MSRILAQAAAEASEGMPSIMFGVIAMVVFIVLGIITWSYRDVANRHEHRVDASKAHH